MKTLNQFSKSLFFLVMVFVLSTGVFKLEANIFSSSDLDECANERVAAGLKYKYCYRDKVAAETELSTLKTQFKNEKENLEELITSKNNQIASLDKELANLKLQREEDKKLSDEKIKELQGTIDILQKDSGNREKELLAENKRLQQRFTDEIKKARDALQEEVNRNIKELEALKKDYEDRIAQLQKSENNLKDELSQLKKLTKDQRMELERLKSQEKELEKQLQNEIQLGQIRLKKFHNKLIINIDNRISFDSGKAELKDEILKAFDKIAQILVDFPENRIMIEGHTDDDKITGGRFKDNWQLSTERALSVLRYLLENKKLDKSRFMAAGYGEHSPIVPNTTPQNKALNRRVDIVVVPRVPH
ncbi:MAG: OmpA family protein [Deltaproteobacteria bacterium]|nr:OmpA family protein [Deltaproteobacteria bacterium]